MFHPPRQCDDGGEKCYEIGSCHGCPHTCDAPQTRQKYEERQQEQQLTGEGEEYGELGFANALEEVLYHNLTSHHGIDYEVDSETAKRDAEQLIKNWLEAGIIK